MGAYRYQCKARVFGCQCTRTRNAAIMRHELKCPVVIKFQKYLNLEEENKALKAEVARLTKVRGRPETKFEHTSLDDFFKTFVSNELYIAAWKRLFGNRKQNAIPALFRLFLAVSPRFFKLQPCRKLVEICGWFGSIRTNNEIHCHTVGEFGQAVMIHLADSVEDYLVELGFKETDAKAMKLEEITQMSEVDRRHICFIRNSLMYEARRRLKGLPIKFNSVKIDLSKVVNKKTDATVFVV